MLSDHDSIDPLAVRVERDGTGSASFDWAPFLDALTRGLEQTVGTALGHGVSIVGVHFVDADGRAATGPTPTGITLVGFTSNPIATNSLTKGDQPCAAYHDE